ncbi:MAG TPA: ABC transporter ATP-binding protein [Hypericibacter adhaerens]|jgi:peptide/nickel transport system ATP-binding protein|uniref:ABC transporter ATP-binding protein n=1 Tax=Hypericibacter adhaerens TaxID=2602016 RepID=UPI002CAB454F|nr:ABC transporter ATP-binding protein [Hypericibacter adhaerens]HWA45220.1 ABC transporter ATP-binding protein [Hypericibacter adhaerens]
MQPSTLASASTDAGAGALLEVRDLSISFRTGRGLARVVDGVSFAIAPREIVGLIGESGSGKTMTLMSLIGLIDDPNVVIEGSIRFKGRELVGAGKPALRAMRGNEMSIVFQDPMTALTPVLKIGGQIEEQIRAHEPIGRKAARRRAIDLLAAVGIADPAAAAERYPHQLSGGMRQRVCIAMALSCRPSLLLADEPTTALDVTVQAQILDLIRHLRTEFGSSIIFVSHDLGVVAEVADRIVVMYGGTIVESGTTEELFVRPLHPYSRALKASIPPLSGERPKRLWSIPGAPPSPLLAPMPGCAFAPRCQHRFEACGARPRLSGVAAHLAACHLVAGGRQAVDGADMPEGRP